MGLYEYMFGGGKKVEDDLEETQKGMGYGELILDNVIGLDNEYESFGEKLGRTINEDEIGFMKQAGQGIYEGAKEFIKAPIETTKEAVREVATSTKDLFTKDLDERLQEMYGVDITSATGDQITAARESVMSDALGASALIPAAGVGIKGAKVLANAMPEYDPTVVGSNFGNYLSKVNPEDKRIPEEDRPNLRMGDMYGMLPRNSEVISERDGITFHRSPKGSYFATAFNPDLGEEDVVGYAMDRGDSTELQVVAEMQNQGIGSELQYLFRSENPDAPTGGLTPAGEATLERTYDRMVDEGLIDDEPEIELPPASVTIRKKSSGSVPATVAEQTENMLDLDRRVDTRIPTTPASKGGEADLVGTGTLISDTEALMRGNSSMPENFAMMTESYPGLRNLWSEDVSQTSQNVISRMTENIVSLYDMSDRLGIAQDSANWYRGANRIALGLSSRFGLPDTKTAGVLAALSPGKDWFQNVGMAERIIKHNAELGDNAPWTSEMDAISMTEKTGGSKGVTAWQKEKEFKTVRGKPWGEMKTPMQKALWIRAYDEAHFGTNFREVSPNGDILGIVASKSGKPSKLVHQSFPNLVKAFKILDGDGSLESISPQLGTAHKVRNFFNNILNPDSPKDVTVDTHQIAAGLFRPLGQKANEVTQGLTGASEVGSLFRFSNKGKAETGMGGSYGLYFDATAEAAKLRNVLPREMQSVSWEQLRTLFPKTLKSNKNFTTAVDAIWRMSDEGTLSSEGARALIIAEAEKYAAGGVPSWKNYTGKRRDIGIATAGLMGAAGLATAEEAPTEEEGFATPQ